MPLILPQLKHVAGEKDPFSRSQAHKNELKNAWIQGRTQYFFHGGSHFLNVY